MRFSKRFVVWIGTDWRLALLIPVVAAVTFLVAAYARQAVESLTADGIEERNAADQARADASLLELDELRRRGDLPRLPLKNGR